MLYTVEGWMLEVRRLLPLPVLSLPVARQPACTISRMPGHFLLAFPVCPGLFCLSYPPLCPVPPFLLHALPTFDLSWVQIQKEVISDLKSERKILFKSWQSTLCRKSKRNIIYRWMNTTANQRRMNLTRIRAHLLVHCQKNKLSAWPPRNQNLSRKYRLLHSPWDSALWESIKKTWVERKGNKQQQ